MLAVTNHKYLEEQCFLISGGENGCGTQIALYNGECSEWVSLRFTPAHFESELSRWEP